MKRSWKNFRLDPNKVYAFIGKVTTIVLANAGIAMFMIYAIQQTTVYR